MPIYVGNTGAQKILGLTKTSQDQWNVKPDTIFHSSLPYVEVIEHYMPVAYKHQAAPYDYLVKEYNPDYWGTVTVYDWFNYYNYAPINGNKYHNIHYYEQVLTDQVKSFLRYTNNQYILIYHLSNGAQVMMPQHNSDIKTTHKGDLQYLAQTEGNIQTPNQGYRSRMDQLKAIDSPWDLTGYQDVYWFQYAFVQPSANGVVTTPNGIVSTLDITVTGITILQLVGLNLVQAAPGANPLSTQPLNPQQQGAVLISRDSLNIQGVEYKNKKFLQVLTNPITTTGSQAVKVSTQNLQVTDLYASSPSFQWGTRLDYLAKYRDAGFMNVDITQGSSQYTLINYPLGQEWYSNVPAVGAWGVLPGNNMITYSGAVPGYWPYSFYGGASVGVNSWKGSIRKPKELIQQSWQHTFTRLSQTDTWTLGQYFNQGLANRLGSEVQYFQGVQITSLSKQQGIAFDSSHPSINQGAQYKMFSPDSQMVARIGRTYAAAIPQDTFSGSPYYSGTRNFPQYEDDILVSIIDLGQEEQQTNNFFLTSYIQDQDLINLSYANTLRFIVSGGVISYQENNFNPSYNIPKQCLFYRQPYDGVGGQWYKSVQANNGSPVWFGYPDWYYSNYDLPTDMIGFPFQSNHIRNRQVSVVSLPVGAQYILKEELNPRSSYAWNGPDQFRGVRSSIQYLRRISQSRIEVRLNVHKTQQHSVFSNGGYLGFGTFGSSVVQNFQICPIL